MRMMTFAKRCTKEILRDPINLGFGLGFPLVLLVLLSAMQKNIPVHLFEIDSLFLNDDRHLNNIAVLEEKGKYKYCPIFDNGAGLLSDTQMSPMDIEPKALISTIKARPFLTSFTRQMNTARTLYGKQLSLPSFSKKHIENELSNLLEYYPQRDRNIICRRVTECILIRQKSGKF